MGLAKLKQPHLCLQQALALDSVSHIAAVHPNNGGISISYFDDAGNWHDSTAKLLRELTPVIELAEGKPDHYFSQNSMRPHRRRCVDNVVYLNAFWADVDCYGHRLTPAEATAKALDIIRRDGLPLPSLVAFSGRGIYLVWTFEKPVYVGSKAANRGALLESWREAERALTKHFEPIGGDMKATDAARVLRIAGTINSKNGEPVRYFETGQRLKSIDQMSAAVLPASETATPAAKPPKRAKRTESAPAKPASRISGNRILNPYTLAHGRMGDIRRLAEVRGGKFSDLRERALFCYAVATAWHCHDETTFLNSLLDFVDDCIAHDGKEYSPERVKALMGTTLRRAVKDWSGAAEARNRYKMRNDTLLRWLEVTPEEQRQMITIIGKDEKRARNTEATRVKRRAAGAGKRKAADSARRKAEATSKAQEAQRLSAQGMTAAAVAEALGVSRRQVMRYLAQTSSKQQGELF